MPNRVIPSPKARLGLTGLTSNAMAMIAPGAFLWLTYALQSQYGSPTAGISMWFGVAVALVLTLATAFCYAELSSLYAGAGSSYLFAEQAFLSNKHAHKWTRIVKVTVGWTSHLYYWIYPGVMVAVAALIAGFMVGQIFPNTFNASVPSPLFMILFCIVFAFGVSYIAFRGVVAATRVSGIINVVQIAALIVFSIMAINYRLNHAPLKGGAPVKGWAIASDGLAYPKVQAIGADGNPTVDKDGNPVFTKDDVTASYSPDPKDFMAPIPDPNKQVPDPAHPGQMMQDPNANIPAFQYHPSARSVVAPHKLSYVIIQVCIAMLLLVGFESVTSMGEEAGNAKRDIPRAVILSVLITGGFCYLLEYFAANYFLHNNYTNTIAAGATAPIGDMAQIIGASAFHSTNGGWWFMMTLVTTVFLALVGTTLTCINTGVRITFAMGRDGEVPNALGTLHDKTLTPHRAIWVLAIVSTAVAIYGVLFYFCGPAVSIQPDSVIASLWHKNIWYSFGLLKPEIAAKVPNSLLIITLVSNFGTFLLYMMTCIVTLVAFGNRREQGLIKHVFLPLVGLLANLLCAAFYVVGPFAVPGMSKKEPLIALIVVALWGICGLVFFLARSRITGKPVLVMPPHAARWHAAPVRAQVPVASAMLSPAPFVYQRPPLVARTVRPLPGVRARCATERCRLVLPAGARYCPRCGNSTDTRQDSVV